MTRNELSLKIIGDKLLLDFGAKFQHNFACETTRYNKQLKGQNCERDLSPTVLKGIKWYTREIRK